MGSRTFATGFTAIFWVGVAFGLRTCGLQGVQAFSLIVFLATVGYVALWIACASIVLLLWAVQAVCHAFTPAKPASR